MTRTIAFFLSCTLLAGPAVASKKAIEQSWGKAGVSFDSYRADALECTAKGYLLDISGTRQAQDFVRASRELEDMTQDGNVAYALADPRYYLTDYAIRMERVRFALRPEQKVKELKTLLQDTVDMCLTGKDYIRFALTGAQRKALSHLKIGSPERRRYLYALASDPDVLAAQRISILSVD